MNSADAVSASRRIPGWDGARGAGHAAGKAHIAQGLDRRAAVAVFIGGATAPVEKPADAMRLLYELTPAEQRVFELVVAGQRTASIAQSCEWRRARCGRICWHLLRVFEKTGRHSRAGLMGLSREIAFRG